MAQAPLRFGVPLVAMPATTAQKNVIAGRDLYHLTLKENLENIIVAKENPHDNNSDYYQVKLLARTGWSVTPFRIFRDYSVFDLELFNIKRGDYLYFFLGQPSWWALAKNMTALCWSKIQERFAIVIVPGNRLIGSGNEIFYRIDDRAVVSKGEYHGLARIPDVSA